MARKAVKVIRDPEVIKLMADPVRREILRQTTHQPQTQTQLANKLNLAKPSMAYHLQALRKAGLIKIGRTRVGAYGILEKFYESTSGLFIEDFDKTPQELRKYFLQIHIERLRGMLSALQLVGVRGGQGVEISSDQLKELAEDIAKSMTRVGERYDQREMDSGREKLLIRIYSEALRIVMASDKWRPFFSSVLEPKIGANLIASMRT